MAPVDQNQSIGPFPYSGEGWTAFVAEFLADDPDGYEVKSGQKEGQIIITNVSKWFISSAYIDKCDCDAISPMLANAVMSLGRKATQASQFEQENLLLKEKLAKLNHEIFGPSSEQRPAPEIPELPETQPELPPDPPIKDKQPKLRLASNAGRKPLPANLPRDIVTLELPESDRGCPCCGKRMVECGEKATEQLTVIPAQFRVTRRIRKKYVCSACDKFVEAPAPKSMMPGASYGSPEFLAYVASLKYQLALPFYRQQTMFELAGLPFKRGTLANLMNTCAFRLSPFLQLFKDELLEQGIIHADETTIQVLKEPDRKPQTKSYLWLYRSAASAARQVVLFDYKQTRSGAHPRFFLEGFKGYLHVDGYSGYNNIENTVRVGCMAHLRRKFTDTTKVIPEGHVDYSFAQQALNVIGELYGIEEKLKKQPPEIVFDTRQRESRPILLRIKKWLDEMRPIVTPRTALGKAVIYAVEQWPTMLRYIDDGDLDIDNNISEREIKQVVIGRKNWLFSDSVDGASTNAAMYSLVQTAKANGLDPSAYLRHLFATLPNLKTGEDIKHLLPWNVKLGMELEPLAAA
jgi:transposase